MLQENVRFALLQRRNDLLARRREDLAEAQDLYGALEPDPVDVAQEVTSARVLERLGDEKLHALEQISRALDRLDQGTYGKCVICGDAIPAQRLRIVPEADRCAACSQSTH